jgi:tetratricopeptide (TPR) repeat protein
MHRIWVVFLVLCLLTGAGWGMQGNLQAQGKGKPKKSKGKGEPSSKHTMQSAKIDYLYIEANTQYLEGNKAEAISLFKEVLGLDANNDAALYNIGRIYAELGDHENARRYCEQALAKNKEIYWYYSELVNAYDQGHMNDKALVTQEALVKKFPDDKNGLYDLAQRYIHVKRYQEALNTYTQLESHTGMNEEIVFRKHQLYMFLNQPEKALVELARLVKANPGEVRYHQARFDILTMMGKTEEALVVLEDMLKANPNDGFALFSLADHYRNLGDLTKSDEYLLRGFANKQVDMNAKAKIVGGLYQMAERDKAILPRVVKLSDMLLQAHPTSAIAAGIVGDVRQANGQPDSARAYYRRSIALDPANEKVWQELLFIDSELKDDAALHKDAEKALDYFPNQVTFLYFYGAGSERTGNEDEAIYAYEKLKKISSADKELKLQALMSLGIHLP